MISSDARELLEKLKESSDRLMVSVHDARVLVDALEHQAHETRGWLLFYLDALNDALVEDAIE
jgi:hypothetical protein